LPLAAGSNPRIRTAVWWGHQDRLGADKHASKVVRDEGGRGVENQKYGKVGRNIL